MIHCFKIGSRNMVHDVNSGALHHVDDTAFDVLKKCGETGERPADFEQVLSCAPASVADEVRRLINEKLLFSPANPDEVFSHMESRRPTIKALCLHIAHECNLRCAYCFAGQGNYSLTDRGLMSFETGKKALDFLINHSGTRRNLEVDFFGGEPMLNFDVVKKLVAYGRSRELAAGKNFRFTLTTNGAFLTDENICYINENFDNVVLSLDGRRHVNDKMRTLHDGSGSYDEIMPKIQKLATAREAHFADGFAYYVRGTFTRHNLDFAEDVIHLADMGFKNISVEPVVAPPEAEYSIRDADLPTLFAEYEKLAHALLSREFSREISRKKEKPAVHFFHFEMDITGGPCIAKRVTGCGAGSEYLAVTPSGKLYPCHQFVGDEKFLLGDLDTGFCAENNFADCHVFNKPECQKCWAKFYCSGGCIATAHYATGSIFKPDKISCDLMRKRIECALYVFAERSLRVETV
ncbi:MAG: thioether cross-link-forming SCIFF peptide maturase [Defluviitaleaceae bacterium]|nr:thioether cross-link-forming SCIFF peptide maturase [Defluviitaleaceae bacterium]